MSFSKGCVISAIVSIVALVLILGTYFLYADKLFQDSYESVIPRIQARHSDEEDNVGWTIFSTISVFSLTNGPIVIILANSMDRAAALYFVMVFVLQVFLIGFLQLLLHRPAPFWVTPNV